MAADMNEVFEMRRLFAAEDVGELRSEDERRALALHAELLLVISCMGDEGRQREQRTSLFFVNACASACV